MFARLVRPLPLAALVGSATLVGCAQGIPMVVDGEELVVPYQQLSVAGTVFDNPADADNPISADDRYVVMGFELWDPATETATGRDLPLGPGVRVWADTDAGRFELTPAEFDERTVYNGGSDQIGGPVVIQVEDTAGDGPPMLLLEASIDEVPDFELAAPTSALEHRLGQTVELAWSDEGVTEFQIGDGATTCIRLLEGEAETRVEAGPLVPGEGWSGRCVEPIFSSRTRSSSIDEVGHGSLTSRKTVTRRIVVVGDPPAEESGPPEE